MSSRARARQEVSAGGVVFRPAEDGPVFLLIRDSYDNWGFPKGHLEEGEAPEAAALREVAEETGLAQLALRAELRAIDWYFRFRGRLIHKICHFYLMETAQAAAFPQRSEGITACRWASYEDAARLISYDNAREVLARARACLAGDGLFSGSIEPAAVPPGTPSVVPPPPAPTSGG